MNAANPIAHLSFQLAARAEPGSLQQAVQMTVARLNAVCPVSARDYPDEEPAMR